MSGHSKWSTIKHRKAAQDSKKGKVFTKLIKEITIAARLGGGDMDSNPRLRLAVTNAKGQSMPKDNIERAIKKGTGELEGVIYEEILYEGYAPHNVAILVEVMTDNRNRSVASVRSIFNKSGGSLGSANSVQYLFHRKGVILIPKTSISEDQLTEIVLELGADDIRPSEEGAYEIFTSIADFETVRSGLEAKEIKIEEANIAFVPQMKTLISDSHKAEQILKILDHLEDDDDVQKVYSNLDLSAEVLAQLEG